jgi:hypothetical protein
LMMAAAHAGLVAATAKDICEGASENLTPTHSECTMSGLRTRTAREHLSARARANRRLFFQLLSLARALRIYTARSDVCEIFHSAVA